MLHVSCCTFVLLLVSLGNTARRQQEPELPDVVWKSQTSFSQTSATTGIPWIGLLLGITIVLGIFKEGGTERGGFRHEGERYDVYATAAEGHRTVTQVRLPPSCLWSIKMFATSA